MNPSPERNLRLWEATLAALPLVHNPHYPESSGARAVGLAKAVVEAFESEVELQRASQERAAETVEEEVRRVLSRSDSALTVREITRKSKMLMQLGCASAVKQALDLLASRGETEWKTHGREVRFRLLRGLSTKSTVNN